MSECIDCGKPIEQGSLCAVCWVQRFPTSDYPHAKLTCPACAAKDAEIHELCQHDARHLCMIECAVDSPSAAEFMEHWTGRALKAEAEIARLTRLVEKAYREGRADDCESFLHFKESANPTQGWLAFKEREGLT